MTGFRGLRSFERSGRAKERGLAAGSPMTFFSVPRARSCRDLLEDLQDLLCPTGLLDDDAVRGLFGGPTGLRTRVDDRHRRVPQPGLFGQRPAIRASGRLNLGQEYMNRLSA